MPANHSHNRRPLPLIDAQTLIHDMADHEPGTSQDAEPKQEDANAPINIKVRATVFSVVSDPRKLAIGRFASVCRGEHRVGGCEGIILVRLSSQS